jgi:mannose-6-phosphate isomerase-like protein (cupin superfamily)
MSDGVLHGPGEGERFEDDVRVAVIKAALPHLTVLEFDVTGGDDYGPDPHTHDDHTDSFFVLEGEVEITLGDETFTAGPGTFVAAPPGVRHGFKVPNPPARFLNVHAPGGFEHEMRRMNAD